MKTHLRTLFLVLFTAVGIGACRISQPAERLFNTGTPLLGTNIPQNANPEQTVTVSPPPSSTPEKSVNSTDSIPEPTATQTLAALPPNLPDLLINLGVDFWNECYHEGNSQIWFSSYPYDDMQLILAEAGVDYLYPRWSPSGDQLAYIKSIPTVVQEGEEYSEFVEGVSIWVEDALGRRVKVSEDLPRINYLWGTTCGPATYVPTPPVWSPDGRFIAFAYLDLLNHGLSYFVVDVEESATQLVYVQKGPERALQTYPGPTWVTADRLAVVVDKNNLLLLSPTGEIIETIQPPVEMKEFDLALIGSIGLYQLQKQGHQLLLSFYEGGGLEGRYLAWYLLDLEAEKWSVVWGGDDEIVRNPLWGNEQSVTCGRNSEFSIFDNDWQIVSSTTLPGIAARACQTLQLFEFEGQLYASFGTKTIDGNSVSSNGIWLMAIQERDPEPEFIVDFANISEPARYKYHVLIDYTWKSP